MGRATARDRSDRSRSELIVLLTVFILGFVLEAVATAPSVAAAAERSPARSLAFSAAAFYKDHDILKKFSEDLGEPPPPVLDLRQRDHQRDEYRLVALAQYNPFSNLTAMTFALPADAGPVRGDSAIRCSRFIDGTQDPFDPYASLVDFYRLEDGTQIITCDNVKTYFTPTLEGVYAGLGVEFRLPQLATAPSLLTIEYSDRQALFGAQDSGIKPPDWEGEERDELPSLFRPWLAVPNAEVHVGAPTYGGLRACSYNEGAATQDCTEVPRIFQISARPSEGKSVLEIAYREQPSKMVGLAREHWIILLPLVTIGAMLVLVRGMPTTKGKWFAAAGAAAVAYSPLLISIVSPPRVAHYAVCAILLVGLVMVAWRIAGRRTESWI